jgi:hypothetical protein
VLTTFPLSCSLNASAIAFQQQLYRRAMPWWDRPAPISPSAARKVNPGIVVVEPQSSDGLHAIHHASTTRLLAQARIVKRLHQVHSDKAEPRVEKRSVPNIIIIDALDFVSGQNEGPHGKTGHPTVKKTGFRPPRQYVSVWHLLPSCAD